jgi:hypothetical protein
MFNRTAFTQKKQKKTKKIAWKKKLHGEEKKKTKKIAWKKKIACTNLLLFFRFINLFLFFQK